ncbi:hypothetical protein ACH5RR_003270, partial [Cinchona calisaya]
FWLFPIFLLTGIKPSCLHIIYFTRISSRINFAVAWALIHYYLPEKYCKSCLQQIDFPEEVFSVNQPTTGSNGKMVGFIWMVALLILSQVTAS